MRHQWVQAPGLGLWCESHPLESPCPWRELVIQAFVDHRLSSVGLTLAALCWGLLGAWRLLSKRATAAHPTPGAGWAATGAAIAAAAWLGLVVSCLGLVLYDAERSAMAALLCALAAVQLPRLPARTCEPEAP